MTRVTPSQTLKVLKYQMGVVKQVIEGLEGRPFSWGSNEYRSKSQALKNIYDLTIVSKTQIKKRGYALRRGANPVGCAYFKAPIKKYADLYILECQCDQVKWEPIKIRSTEEKLAEARERLAAVQSYIANLEGENESL